MFIRDSFSFINQQSSMNQINKLYFIIEGNKAGWSWKLNWIWMGNRAGVEFLCWGMKRNALAAEGGSHNPPTHQIKPANKSNISWISFIPFIDFV